MTAQVAHAADLRSLALRERRERIFSTFRALPAGQTLYLVDDQDLESVYYDFLVEMPQAFSWEYLEAGPEIWRVNVTRLATICIEDSCCGVCGAARAGSDRPVSFVDRPVRG